MVIKGMLGAVLAIAVTGLPMRSMAQTPVKHVFVIVLENKGYAETFGPGSLAPYLSKTLTAQGQLLPNYYGIGHNSNPNYLAMISGQAPDAQTQSDCQIFQEFTTNNVWAPNGQLVGQGCVYPSSVNTVANQLEVTGRTWHGYMESMPAPCTHPALNTVDTTQKATVLKEYAGRHNPFIYFHGLIDLPTCAANDVPLTQMQTDLAAVKTTPNFSFIVPNLCHDGHDKPCANGEPGGLVSADLFLRKYVPMITASPAYQQDGLLVILFDEAEFGPSPASDATACCGELPGPNSSLPGIAGLGGGRVGAVLLSRFVKAGTVNGTPYNHYSFLKSLQNLFGLPYLGYAQAPGTPAFGADVFGTYLTDGGDR